VVRPDPTIALSPLQSCDVRRPETESDSASVRPSAIASRRKRSSRDQALAAEITRKQRRPRSRRTLAELSKCREPANARDACREASDEQAPEQGTPSRFGERGSEPAARSALTSRGSAPTPTSGGEYYPPVSGVAAIARESAEGPVRAGASPVSQPSRIRALGNALRTTAREAPGPDIGELRDRQSSSLRGVLSSWRGYRGHRRAEPEAVHRTFMATQMRVSSGPRDLDGSTDADGCV
jgi:hypothetical protein